MQNGTIFITGASTGLGRATAELFAARDWQVIATMRKPQDAGELATLLNVKVLSLDVTDPEQINSAVEQAVALADIDVVFNNAGYGLVGPLEGFSDDQLVRQVDTNLLSVMRVTKAFLPHLRERESGTIISITSIGGLVTFPFNSVYHATKWAIEGWSESLAFELRPFGITVKTVSPGGIRTDFSGRSLVLGQHEAYAEAVARVTDIFLDPERTALGSSPEQIAEVVWQAATDGESRLRYIAGVDANELHTRRLQIGDEAFRREIGHIFLGE